MANYDALKASLKATSQFLIALGNEKRQAIIIHLLENHDCQGIQVSELTAVTDLSRPAVSHHLKVLKNAGIIGCRSAGTKNFYFLLSSNTELQKLQNLLNTANQILNESQENAE